MAETKILTGAWEQGGLLGLIAAGAVITLVLGVVMVLRFMGFSAFGDKSKLVDDGKLQSVSTGVTEIKTKLDGLETRLSSVEHDVTSRATQAEVHKLELAVVRMEAEMRAQGMTLSAVSNGVDRIQEFMYRAAARSKGDE